MAMTERVVHTKFTQKAISLWQPWAQLWAAGPKLHETRSWRATPQTLLVHASKALPVDLPHGLELLCCEQFGADWRQTLPRGALIGLVDVVEVLPVEFAAFRTTDEDITCGDWSPGRFAWRRGKHGLFRAPVAFQGLQRLFNVPDSIIPRDEGIEWLSHEMKAA